MWQKWNKINIVFKSVVCSLSPVRHIVGLISWVVLAPTTLTVILSQNVQRRTRTKKIKIYYQCKKKTARKITCLYSQNRDAGPPAWKRFFF